MDDKEFIAHHERATHDSPLSEEESQLMRSFEGKKGKRVVRKIDYRLISILAILYLMSHIDRANIGNAKIEGMEKDLGLVGNQYNIAATIFFAPYIIFEVPSNIILKKVRPCIWLSLLVVGWGTIMTLMGIVRDFRGLVACRVFLGLVEAGFFPGAVFIVSSWYVRTELQERLALFYTASAFSGAFSGLLAFAIAKLDGARGIAGWRWIFLIEGAITVAAGLAMPFLIVEDPKNCRWLSDDEKRFVDCRLRLSGVRTASEESDKFSWRLLWSALVDWKVNLAILMAWANAAPTSAFKFTMPQILTGLGYSSSHAQLMSIPPYVAGGISAWVVGRFSDQFAWRFPFVIGPMAVLLTGLSILFGFSSSIESHAHVMYFAIVLSQIGIYPLLPGVSAWTGNNLAPSWKRSIGIAWVLAAGNFGSLIGTNVFLDREAPVYTTGYATCIAIVVLGMLACMVNEVLLLRCNKQRDEVAEAAREQYTQEELEKQGDKSPLYKYTL
ncbi:hypothetical protein ASPWEDRAFT_114829 [Aspergillus wentii DTO 134E9]|uniref:Major facilitator superfamily (MFS) profile domain-containing protein n=1 Tax=Aspergillus wentii DTO 134E9 TaxID=1073089 RepID=A0A1L9REK3_ASPWE|nr:uncharacterized protein ASPWEDRAFT_114829 [Aspergillus wentii DTO 134E9]KAI9933601.1 hypothetical protein MW887_008074 [Aspergillus wentii]OJJ33352.1 hypothetical protein ASPWEDRAFT_114829 [Aspergillus wentii DTO 134E9]